VSEVIRAQYIASGLLTPARVVALPGGADTEAFSPRPPDAEVRRRLGGDDAPLVGMVGGLRVMKGHAVVLEAVARLRARGIVTQVVFVGQGRWEASIRRQVEDAELTGRVLLSGFAADLPAAMAAMDIALYVPLESDGMSRVIFEYLAAGRALIASRTGLVPEVLHDGEDSLLVPAGEPAPLAEAIARLASDRALRAKLGAAGRRLVEERYSGARVAERLEGLYASVARG
jgi:glycosyltransferase involved in cell wall biosynthesis